MPITTIIFRVTLSILISGSIGFDREYKNRPAGIRTHVLVSLGATIVALVQRSLTSEAIILATTSPQIVGAITIDQARLIAQVVSGIGFLGAGTIVFTNKKVTGLTTAASLWAVAGLGISIGMGYYSVAIISAFSIILVLTVLSKVIKVPSIKKLEINYIHRTETKEFLTTYFNRKFIAIKDVDFSIDIKQNQKIYRNVYTVELPRGIDFTEVIEDISSYPNVTRVRLIGII